MFALLRLMVNVVLLQTLEQIQRRKEIYQPLTSGMEEIFQFLLALLEKYYRVYWDNQAIGADNCSVCMATLNIFTALVE